jgi:hypothetical protein
MAIVTHTRRDGKELTPEEKAARDARMEAAAKRPYVYDPDSPLLTDKQLAEFRPANFSSMEERSRAMKAAGITDREQTPALETVSNK